ncbi:hypothetical protein ACVWYG_000764 [Pedobacter sp. UYEF25]
MKTKISIGYRFMNWGKMESIFCEADFYDQKVFTLIKNGLNVGIITKSGNTWTCSPNSIFLPSDIVKIGNYIDEYLTKMKEST